MFVLGTAAFARNDLFAVNCNWPLVVSSDRTLDNLQMRFARLMAEYVSHQAKMKQRLSRVENRDEFK